MLIQWFPGHMTKALRQMEQSVKKVDSLIYLLDSRAPFSCINPQFSHLLTNKPTVYVLNKCDLVDRNELLKWKEYFESKGHYVILTDSSTKKDAKTVIAALNEINREKIERNKAKGINYAVKAMVIGMPNTGKSTLINSLCADKRTITGDRPGVTRGEQWVKLDNGIILLDTPGTLCHSIEVERTALNLAFIGCIRDAVLDTEGLALEFIKIVKEIYPENLRNRYNVTLEEKTPLEIYEAIGKNRGFLLRGGEIDYTRTAAAILDDFRKGRMGKMILELPQ